jgi:hypothetical protein
LSIKCSKHRKARAYWSERRGLSLVSRAYWSGGERY